MKKITYYHTDLLEIIHIKNHAVVYREHNHASHYTAGLVLKGSVILKHSDKTATYTPADFFVIPPWQMHMLKVPDNSELLSLCIHRDILQNLSPARLYPLLHARLQALFPTVPLPPWPAIPPLFYSAGLFETADHAATCYTRALYQNLQENINVQQMAEAMHMSKYHYIRRFKQNVGMTPHQFLLQSRIRRAQQMIQTGSAQAETAATFGFYDQSHFIKCFKSIVGLTPAAYKQAVIRLSALNTEPE